MFVRINGLVDVLGYWIPIKAVELIVFMAVFLIAGELLENFRSGGLEYSSKIAIGIAIFYGVIALYWPLSFALTVWLKSNYEWFAMAELAFYLTHSIIALSIAYNGIFGFSDRIGYASPLVLAWGGVTIIKIAILLVTSGKTLQ